MRKKNNKVDLTTNNVFVQFGFISWQEVKSSAPRGRHLLHCQLSQEKRGRGGKNKNVRRGQINPVLGAPCTRKHAFSYKFNKHQRFVRAAILSNGFNVTAHPMAVDSD